MHLRADGSLDLASHTISELGESPRWDTERGVLWWVDIIGSSLHALHADGRVTTHTLPRAAGAVNVAADGRLLLATTAGVELFDPATGESVIIVPIEAELGERRMNDAAVDPAGRVYAGTMRWNAGDPPHDGVLYRVTGQNPALAVLTGLGCPNGLAWPRPDLLAYVDSMTRSIALWSVEPETGDLLEQTGSIDVSRFDGVPDGLTLDAEGALWCAFWNGGAVRRFALDGTVLATIELPTRLVTAVAFGGVDLETLYITTAREQPAPDARGSAVGGNTVEAVDTVDTVEAVDTVDTVDSAAGLLYRSTPGQRGVVSTLWPSVSRPRGTPH